MQTEEGQSEIPQLDQAQLDAVVKAAMADLARKEREAKSQHEFVLVQLEPTQYTMMSASEERLNSPTKKHQHERLFTRYAEQYVGPPGQDVYEESALDIKLEELRREGRKVLGFKRRGASWLIKVMKERK
jgi:hypothetical protein